MRMRRCPAPVHSSSHTGRRSPPSAIHPSSSVHRRSLAGSAISFSEAVSQGNSSARRDRAKRDLRAPQQSAYVFEVLKQPYSRPQSASAPPCPQLDEKIFVYLIGLIIYEIKIALHREVSFSYDDPVCDIFPRVILLRHETVPSHLTNSI